MADEALSQLKTCAKCRNAKPLSAFTLQSNGKFGRRSRCRECNKQDHAQNRAKVSAKEAAYRAANSDNPDYRARRRAIQRRSDAKKRATPRGRLENAISAGIAGSLARSSKAGRSWQGLVGYNLSQLMAHLESLFLPGMSWANYGEWHVDHIVPISAFNYETPDHIDFKRAWSLSNLQPLWAFDNMSKKDRLERPFQPSLLI